MINETCLTVFDRIKTFKELYFVNRNNCPIFPSALSVFLDSRPNFHVRPYVTLRANQTHLNTLTNENTALLSQSSMSGTCSYQLDLTWLHVRSKAQTVLKQ